MGRPLAFAQTGQAARPFTNEPPSHVTASGVPADAAFQVKRINLNKTLVPMFQKILPEGPI